MHAEELVLLIALVILVVALWRPASRAVTSALDARGERIRQELDDAQRLHEEAKALLAKYQRQLHEGQHLAAEILESATAERARLEARMKQDFDASVRRRTQQAMDRIAQEEQRALAEVRARAADLTIRTTRRLIADKLDASGAQRLVGGAIEELGRKLG
jgi:F-type H+-transporting ATPase subunit b